MKRALTLLFVLVLVHSSIRGQNVTIIESQSNPGHVMDQNWFDVATGMGYTASVNPQTTLDNTTFYSTTDILVVSSGVIALTPTRINNIIGYIAQGGKVYLQTEYDCSFFIPNAAFEQIVVNFGGTFNWAGITAGVLAPMNVSGSLASTNNTIPPLTYFWYGCKGTIGICTPIEPFLEFNSEYFGFIYCAPGTNGGRVITDSDQDWVNQLTSTPLMENILTNLSDNSYQCISTTGGNVFLGNDTVLCTGQSLLLDALNSGSTYTWSTGETSQTISVAAAGTYWVEVDNGTCIFSDTILVDLYNVATPDLGNDTTICITQNFILDAGIPGTTYLWSTGEITQDITVSSSGSYWVQAGPSSCAVADTVVITFSTIISVNLGSDTTICSSAPFTIDVGIPGLNYQWSTGDTSQSIQVSNSGAYWVSVTNGGCTGSDTLNIDLFLSPVVDLGTDTITCSGTSITLNAGSDFVSYQWNTGPIASTITVDAPGQYIVQVTDSNDCKVSDTLNFLNHDEEIINLGADTLICPGGILILQVPPVFQSYTWQDGSSASNFSVDEPGTYFVSAVDINGCSSKDTLVVTGYYSVPDLLLEDTVVCPGIGILLVASQDFISYQWNDGSVEASLYVDQIGKYSLDAYTMDGCKASDTSLVSKKCPNILFVPTAFSPNGDGVNDLFYPIGYDVSSLRMMVYNRWGELLFESNNMNDGWDGQYRNAACEVGTYVWWIVYQIEGESQSNSFKGNVTLVR